MDLMDVYRIFHPTTAQCTFLQKPLELSSKQIISQIIKKVSKSARNLK
jgi:hypothetical protein